jgi:hypothetical protein
MDCIHLLAQWMEELYKWAIRKIRLDRSFSGYGIVSRQNLQIALNRRFPLIVFLMVLIPPYASNGYPLNEVLRVNAFILTHPIKHQLLPVYPIFNILALFMFFSSLTIGNRIARLFSSYAGFSYILFAVVQNVSVSDECGFAVSISNVFLFLLVSVSWFYEARSGQNDFSVRIGRKWKLVFLLLALMAIWQPVDGVTMRPDFNPIYLISSGSGLTFCMMTTVYLAVMLYYFPSVNLLTLRITSLVGLLIGLGNLWLEFIHFPHLLWVGILHLPLVILSGCGLWLSHHAGAPVRL